MLNTFGTTKVLSSPRLSVMNNQTALLKVVENYVYFNVKADTTTTANFGADDLHHHTAIGFGWPGGQRHTTDQRDRCGHAQRTPDDHQCRPGSSDPNPDLKKNDISNLFR
jgi:general secretion pathway protein D